MHALRSLKRIGIPRFRAEGDACRKAATWEWLTVSAGHAGGWGAPRYVGHGWDRYGTGGDTARMRCSTAATHVRCQTQGPVPDDMDSVTGIDGASVAAPAGWRAGISGRIGDPPSVPMPLSALLSATVRRSPMCLSPNGAPGTGRSATVVAVPQESAARGMRSRSAVVGRQPDGLARSMWRRGYCAPCGTLGADANDSAPERRQCRKEGRPLGREHAKHVPRRRRNTAALWVGAVGRKQAFRVCGAGQAWRAGVAEGPRFAPDNERLMSTIRVIASRRTTRSRRRKRSSIIRQRRMMAPIARGSCAKAVDAMPYRNYLKICF